jgi:hypothetical protein
LAGVARRVERVGHFAAQQEERAEHAEELCAALEGEASLTHRREKGHRRAATSRTVGDYNGSGAANARRGRMRDKGRGAVEPSAGR